MADGCDEEDDEAEEEEEPTLAAAATARPAASFLNSDSRIAYDTAPSVSGFHSPSHSTFVFVNSAGCDASRRSNCAEEQPNENTTCRFCQRRDLMSEPSYASKFRPGPGVSGGPIE
jgi:hypothetical protein